MREKLNSIPAAELERLINEAIREMGGEQGVLDEIRRQKCVFIDDILRCYRHGVVRDKDLDARRDPVALFDYLYDLDLPDLELLLATLSAKLSKYMRDKVADSNRRGIGNHPYDFPPLNFGF